MILSDVNEDDVSHTISEKQEITACNNADSPVQGMAPEAVEFLHGEGV